MIQTHFALSPLFTLVALSPLLFFALSPLFTLIDGWYSRLLCSLIINKSRRDLQVTIINGNQKQKKLRPV